MLNQFSRTQLLLGEDGMERLFKSRAAVFGDGFPAAFAAEALVRSGVGAIDIFGGDAVIGKRLMSINPDLKLGVFDVAAGDLSEYNYIIDAAGSYDKTAELAARAAGTPMISIMDMTRRQEVSEITVGDINKIKCPRIDKLRYELRQRGVKKLKCVYSTEKPEDCMDAPHVLSAAGLIAAGEVVKDLSRERKEIG